MNRSMIALVFLAACSVRAGNPEPKPGRFEGVGGRVVATRDGKDVAVAGAVVRVGDKTALTDEQGLWRVESVTAATERITVQIHHASYAPLVRAYATHLLSGSFLSERLLPVAVRKRIRVHEGGTIVVPGIGGTGNDAAVRLPPAFAAFTTDVVDVAVAIIRPWKKDELQAFPGDFVGRSSELETGHDLLRTFGTLDVSFSTGGKAVENVTLAAPADVVFRLDARLASGFPEGSSIPTWTLDTATGEWASEGTARVVVQNGEKYASYQTSHFTWWNVDQPLDEHACLALKLMPASAQDRDLLDNLSFSIAGIDYAGLSLSSDFSVDQMAVVTGWRGHKVALSFGSRAGQLNPMLTKYLSSLVFNGATSISLPVTSASGYFHTGPGGVELIPEKHCHYIERQLQVPLGRVTGSVLDEFGEPLPGALVAITELGRTALADEEGRFAFDGVPWLAGGGFSMGVVAIPPAGRRGLVYQAATVQRDRQDQHVAFIAEPEARAPAFTEVLLSDSTPPAGGQTPFSIVVDDDNASLQWGLELCGAYASLKSGTGESSDNVLCHHPPGNPAQLKTVAVATAAVDAHLAHGDTAGPCDGTDLDSPPRSSALSADAQTCSGEVSGLRSWSESLAQGHTRFGLEGTWRAGTIQGAQTLLVLAKDPLGYVTAAPVPLTVRNNAPIVVVNAPAYPRTNESVSLQVRASDPDGDVLTYKWSLNGQARPEIGPSLVLSGLIEGPNYVQLSVSDGKTTVTQTLTLYVLPPEMPAPTDTTPPDTYFMSTPPFASALTLAAFTFASAATDVVRFECRLDAGAWATCGSPYQIAVFEDGTHTLAVRAVDGAGLADPSPAYTTWSFAVDRRFVYVANLTAPPVAPTESERRALLAQIVAEQFLAAAGTENHERYGNFLDLQWKHALDANTATTIDYNPYTYLYRPVTSSTGPFTGAMSTVGTGGYEPEPFFPPGYCLDIPLVGTVCLNQFFLDDDGELGEKIIDVSGYGTSNFGIRTIDAANGMYLVDVTLPVAFDVLFEPPSDASLYDRADTEYAGANDLSTFLKAHGRIEFGLFRFSYQVTMPVGVTTAASALTFFPQFQGEYAGDFQFLYRKGPYCNNNLATTETPYAGATYTIDPELWPFGYDGLLNYPGLISDPATTYYSLVAGPYPHSAASAAGGSGAGRDLRGVGALPFEFGMSDNPNNCVVPADACTGSAPPQDGGVEFPSPVPACEYPNVSNNSDDATYRISEQITSIIPYLQGEMRLQFQNRGWTVW